MKKKKAACQGRPSSLYRNNAEHSEPSKDQQQETSHAAALRAALAKAVQ